MVKKIKTGRKTRALWHESSKQAENFTSKLLKWWFVKHGGEIVDSIEESPDIILASACSPREASILQSGRKLASKAHIPFLMGGAEAYCGATYLAWADYICIGEGYNVIRELATSGLDALGMDNILSIHDPDAEIEPDYYIPWGQLPVIQTTEKGCYYLAGRGCRNKCKFCYTSWTLPHSVVPEQIRLRAEAKLPKNKHILYVTNDDGGLARYSGSTTVKQFLTEHRSQWPRLLRLGIEGITEERRKALNKPVSDEDLAACIIKARELGIELQLFFIIGWDDEVPPEEAMLNMVQMVGIEKVRWPRIHLKYTWFEPSPHTPLGDYSFERLRSWDYKLAAMCLRSYSGRYRVFKAGLPGRAVWCAMLQRLPRRKVPDWYENRKQIEVCKSFREAVKIARPIVGQEYIDGTAKDVPWKRVKTRIVSKPQDKQKKYAPKGEQNG